MSNITEKNTIREDTDLRHQKKYTNRNFFHRFALDGFYDQVAIEVAPFVNEKILEFGCGEGFFVDKLRSRGLDFKNYLGIDIRESAISHAKRRCPLDNFVVQSLFDVETRGHEDQYPLVIASQVLEHLYEPQKYLEKLLQITSRRLLLTVPHEPWFRLMNFARARDILRFGNHPEHINHWGPASFGQFLTANGVNKFQIIKKFPFLIASCDL